MLVFGIILCRSGLDSFSAGLAINLSHISPWEATVGLFKGMSRCIKNSGYFLIYGPFNLHGRFTSQGNESFDKDLRERNKSWGIRDVSDMEAVAHTFGFILKHRIDLPSNNMLLVFQNTKSD